MPQDAVLLAGIAQHAFLQSQQTNGLMFLTGDGRIVPTVGWGDFQSPHFNAPIPDPLIHYYGYPLLVDQCDIPLKTYQLMIDNLDGLENVHL